jgi:hypothetical protein
MARRIERYACIQTVNRRYLQPARDGKADAVPEAPVLSCDQIRSARNDGPGPFKLEATDRFRLEVTVLDGREIHSWPGATRFDTRNVDEIIREGPIGTGAFGTHLLGVFDNPGVNFRYVGEKPAGNRTLFEYSYHVSLEASHYRVKVGASWQPMPYDGSFWLDPETLELERLTIRADQVPAATSICRIDAAMDYQRVRIGDGDVLLPRQSELDIALQSRRETNNIATFSDCREYQAESALVFDAPPDIENRAARRVVRPVMLPMGLPITLALTASIDTDTAAAGDPVSAKVIKPVHRDGSNDILIPTGATVRGRITRLEHHILPTPYFLIAMTFSWLEVEGGSSPFAARFDGSVELAKQLGANLVVRGRGVDYWDVGAFLFPTAKSRYVLPAGYESKWMTLATPLPRFPVRGARP